VAAHSPNNTEPFHKPTVAGKILKSHQTHGPAKQVEGPGYQKPHHTKRFHHWQICHMMITPINQEEITRLLLQQTHAHFPMISAQLQSSVSKKQISYLLLEYYHLKGHLELVQSRHTQPKHPCILHVTGSFKLNFNFDNFKPTTWNQDYSTSLKDWAPLLVQEGCRATSYKGVIFEVLPDTLQKTQIFWDVMLCQRVLSALMVRVKHSKNCGLISSKDEGTEIHWHVSTCILSADRHNITLS
jgi:hypothetical protein